MINYLYVMQINNCKDKVSHATQWLVRNSSNRHLYRTCKAICKYHQSFMYIYLISSYIKVYARIPKVTYRGIPIE